MPLLTACDSVKKYNVVNILTSSSKEVDFQYSIE